MKNSPRKLKGFTIIELIIVIAIIGVLAAILVPAMSAYYTRSRIKSANADAKMVYNAAQTEAQKYITIDRVSATSSGLNGTYLLVYYPDDNAFSYGTAATVDLKAETKISIDAADLSIPEQATAVRLIQAVNRTVSNSVNKSWAVYINNYIVKGCIAAESVNTDAVGYYTVGRTYASERSSLIFDDWLRNTSTGDTEINCLVDVGQVYLDAETETTT